MPDYTLPPSANPLCNSNLIQCLDIDDVFAGHLWGHVQVLPQTAHRDAAALFPFGVTLGLLGQVVGSIGTQYVFWNAEGAAHSQLGPLRLSLTGRLLPLSPPLSSGRSEETSDRGEASAYHQPPKQLDAFPTAQKARQKTTVQGGGGLYENAGKTPTARYMSGTVGTGLLKCIQSRVSTSAIRSQNRHPA